MVPARPALTLARSIALWLARSAVWLRSAADVETPISAVLRAPELAIAWILALLARDAEFFIRASLRIEAFHPLRSTLPACKEIVLRSRRRAAPVALPLAEKTARVSMPTPLRSRPPGRRSELAMSDQVRPLARIVRI